MSDAVKELFDAIVDNDVPSFVAALENGASINSLISVNTICGVRNKMAIDRWTMALILLLSLGRVEMLEIVEENAERLRPIMKFENYPLTAWFKVWTVDYSDYTKRRILNILRKISDTLGLDYD